MYYGASLQALTKLNARKGYRLVAVEPAGVNAFFLRNDVATHIPACDASRAYRLLEKYDVLMQKGEDVFRYAEQQGLPLVGDRLSRDVSLRSPPAHALINADVCCWRIFVCCTLCSVCTDPAELAIDTPLLCPLTPRLCAPRGKLSAQPDAGRRVTDQNQLGTASVDNARVC